ncbi:glycine zipper family protein [Nitrospira sp. BLG_2]|uniref:glycine zipper family protein n=1 Tax=Nitrospira sp. BLG_2 TaxID=3397507 RepID=UPI003B9CB6CB
MNRRRISAVFILLMLSACSGARPVLYPNAHMQSVGKEAAEQDIEACKQSAESAGAEQSSGGKGGRVATSTAVGAGVGAASGAVGGAISGGAGRGSMIGAASGAVWGLLTGLFHAVAGPSQPNQAYTNFVNRCLQEKGYEVTGWQ